MYVCLCGIGSKTTEPIELKFKQNIRVGPVKVIGNFFKKKIMFVCLFVRFLYVNIA